MATVSRVRDSRGVWVDRITGSPDQPVIDYPATCGVCGHVSTVEQPECSCGTGRNDHV